MWGNIVDNIGTALNLPELGLSEYLRGGQQTSNTGRIPLNVNASEAISDRLTNDSSVLGASHYSALPYPMKTTAYSPYGVSQNTGANDDRQYASNPYDTSSAYGSTAQRLSSGSGDAYDTSGDRAYLDDQEARVRSQLGLLDTTERQGLEQLGYDYNRNVSDINKNRERALSDFSTKRTDTERSRDAAINRVDSNARTLANSLRRRIGMAGGSNSSAYQFAAPGAVAREATKNRSNVMESFGMNFRDLGTAEERAKKDFEDVLAETLAQRRQGESDFRAGVLGQRSQIDNQLAEIARQRALLNGGGYREVKQAMSPYASAIDARQAEIAGLFDKYKNPYSVRQVNVQTPNLRDYVVDRAAISANNTRGQDPLSPYGQFLRRNTDEEEKYL